MKTTTHSNIHLPIIHRPDEFIRQDVLWKLTQNGFVDGRNLEVIVHDGIVILEGSLNLKSDKKRIIGLLENIDGLIHLENRLKIQRVSRFTDDHSMHGF